MIYWKTDRNTYHSVNRNAEIHVDIVHQGIGVLILITSIKLITIIVPKFILIHQSLPLWWHRLDMSSNACFPPFCCRWPLQFCRGRSVVPFHSTVAVVPFHSDVAIAADWLSSYSRTAKIGFNPIATERQLRRNGRWQRQIRNGIFHVSNAILTPLT